MKINRFEKKDGTPVYRTNVYLGVDVLTGKQVRTTATGRTRKICEMKAKKAINRFINNGKTTTRKKVNFKTFSALIDSWFKSYKLTVKAHSIRVMNNFLKVYILPSLGQYQPDKISPILVQEIVNVWANNANTSKIIKGKREKGKCKDYKLLLNIICRIFDYAIRLGELEVNPAKRVSAPKLKVKTVKEIKYLDKRELKHFLSYLDNLEPSIDNQLHSTLYRFLLATGLRIGEALALNWLDFDFDQQSVRVSKTLLQTGKVQESPKTRESQRLIFFDSQTTQLLKRLKNQQINGQVSLIDTLIFSHKKKISTYKYELSILKKHLKNAGAPDIGFHGFRHTHASLLMNHDINPKEIQTRLGHKDYSTTMNTYGHLSFQKDRDTAKKFENILKSL
ncbi:Mobile element protein [Lactococcus lactis subsp. lactis]|uniref:tyrosine-type recombinase/integrase n=1 Tax=Lactococcus lactis TaxID=1358 RepID=UPI00071CE43E|nr:site-specific integrase [Lactococcus lactis]KST91121.1 Mobile element protein [Lactococcus lactis subsp. lactis]